MNYRDIDPSVKRFFPWALFLVLAIVFSLFALREAHSAEWKTIPYFCHAMYGMPRNCDSVKKYAGTMGMRAAIWMARKCGALEADIAEARQCIAKTEK